MWDGMVVTGVRFSSVRRIQVSSITTNLSDGLDPFVFITGMCVHFWDTDEPVYVGQWRGRVGCLIDLHDTEEKIAGISICVGHEYESFDDEPVDNFYQCRVTGIRVTTLRGSSGIVNFQVGERSPMFLDFSRSGSTELVRRLRVHLLCRPVLTYWLLLGRVDMVQRQ